MQKNKKAVVYHFYEVDNTHKDNLFWFLLLSYKSDIDFFIVLADKDFNDLPILPNIKYLTIKNNAFDYGGYSNFFAKCNWQDYEKIVFINSTVRGPILPTYVNDWFDSFTYHLKDDIGIVGSTINILNDVGNEGKIYREFYKTNTPYSHVQTNVFALNQKSLEFLAQNNFWTNKSINTKLDTVIHFEIRLSQLILQNKLNLKCLLAPYNRIDFRQPIQDINKFSSNGDVRYKDCYFGHSIDPYQIMFVSTNRQIFDLSYIDSICLEQLEQSDNLIDTFKSKSIVKWLTQKYMSSKLY